ncbi:MAG TPA: hypothetical protein PKC21_01670 [Oligoflexia bacterium]|nr:hypothetical protein [Oligoflexia bacterium]
MQTIKRIIVKISLISGILLSINAFAKENQKFYGASNAELGAVEVQLFHLGKRYVNFKNHAWEQRHFWTLTASVFGDILECEDLQTWHYFNTVIDRNVTQRYIYCVSENSQYGLRVRFNHDFDYLSPDRPYGVLKSNIGYAEVYMKSIGNTKNGNYRNPDTRLFDRFTMPNEHRLAKIDLHEEQPSTLND